MCSAGTTVPLKNARLEEAPDPWPGSDYVLTRGELKTTNDTETTLFSLSLENGRAYYVTAKVVARQSDGSNRAFYIRAACAYRETGGSSLQPANTNWEPVTFESDANWNCFIDVDTTNHVARVRVKGAASADTYWVGSIEYQSVATSA